LTSWHLNPWLWLVLGTIFAVAGFTAGEPVLAFVLGASAFCSAFMVTYVSEKSGRREAKV